VTSITRNAVRCLTCGETIESRHRHDFVNGGHDDARLSDPQHRLWRTSV
jgi:hypothetical protein